MNFRTRDEAKDYLKHQLQDYLRARGFNPQKNFKCISLNHNDTHPSMSFIDKNGDGGVCYCHSCNATFDIFGAIGELEGISGYADQFEYACKLYGIQIEDQKQKIYKPSESANYTKKYKEWNEAAIGCKYWTGRGFTAEDIKKFNLGFNSKTQEAIIPVDEIHYIRRSTNGEKKYLANEGARKIYNFGALFNGEKPIFILEGEIDAISIMAAKPDAEAVGLGGIGAIGKLAKAVKDRKPIMPLILALDNDEAGQKAQKELADILAESRVPYTIVDAASFYEGLKDANELLVKDRAKLEEHIAQAEEKALKEAESHLEELRLAEEQQSVAGELDRFLIEIEHRDGTTNCMQTGFEDLDNILGGGLYPGLYGIGAISSLGKTSFCLQLADQIAEKGNDVIIFSLEMDKKELMAKSLSRFTYTTALYDECIADVKREALTTRQILNKKLDARQQERLGKAAGKYFEFAKNIRIVYGIGDVGIEEIKEAITTHISLTGRKPFILIDYLQIMKPADVRLTDKQNIDKAVVELKRLSVKYGIPIMAISSFNRDNYNEPVNNAAFKESGAVEYSCDVLLGMQFKYMEYEGNEKETERKQRLAKEGRAAAEKSHNGEPNKLQIKVLKNRNGCKGTLEYSFISSFNFFKECMPAKDKEQTQNKAKTF